MKRQIKTIVGAVICIFSGACLIFVAFSELKPQSSEVVFPVVFGALLEVVAFFLLRRALWRWRLGRGGRKGYMLFDFEAQAPMSLQLGPIHGRGTGLLQVALRPTCRLPSGMVCVVRLIDLLADPEPGTNKPRVLWDCNVSQKGSIDLFLEHPIQLARPWEFVFDVVWPEHAMQADLLRGMRQLSQKMRLEVIVCGQCTDVSIPPEPDIIAPPRDTGGRGFEVIMK